MDTSANETNIIYIHLHENDLKREKKRYALQILSQTQIHAAVLYRNVHKNE